MVDKKRRIQQLQKSYDEALTSNFTVDLSDPAVDVIRKNEESNKLTEADNDRVYWFFAKTKKPTSMRMIFAVKETSRGRVRNLERITNIVRDVECMLSYVDSFETTKSGNIVYLDIVKKLE